MESISGAFRRLFLPLGWSVGCLFAASCDRHYVKECDLETLYSSTGDAAAAEERADTVRRYKLTVPSGLGGRCILICENGLIIAHMGCFIY